MKDKDLVYDRNGIGYDKDGKAYDKEGNAMPISKDHDYILDPGIARAVITLQQAGVETLNSCEGGEGHDYDYPTIRFGGTSRCGFLALGIATTQANLERWQNTPAANPFYQGLTPVEVARVLLKPKKR